MNWYFGTFNRFFALNFAIFSSQIRLGLLHNQGPDSIENHSLLKGSDEVICPVIGRQGILIC